MTDREEALLRDEFCREAFEQLYKDENLTRNGYGYKYMGVQIQWQAWRAAWNTRALFEPSPDGKNVYSSIQKSYSPNAKEAMEFEDKIGEIMLQEWNEWCADTGYFPDDLEWRGGNGVLYFEPSKWVSNVAARIRKFIEAQGGG